MPLAGGTGDLHDEFQSFLLKELCEAEHALASTQQRLGSIAARVRRDTPVALTPTGRLDAASLSGRLDGGFASEARLDDDASKAALSPGSRSPGLAFAGKADAWGLPTQPADCVIRAQPARDQPVVTPTLPGALEEAVPKREDKQHSPRRASLDLKTQIRCALLKPEAESTDYYSEQGHWQRIARSALFEQVTLLIIAVNAIWIWIDTDHNESEVLVEALPVFQLVENFFCVFFAIELSIRFMAFESKKNCVRDAWFVFDSMLVFFMVFETWVMSIIILESSGASSGSFLDASMLRILRLLRLSRMGRMVRLFRAVPELLVMIKGIVAATRSVMVTLSLLMLILYVFGITFCQLLDKTESGRTYFPTVPESMLSLVFYGIVLDGTPDVVLAIGKDSFFCSALLFVFILMASFTVLNMLIGVMCETVRVVSTVENERMTLAYQKEQLLDMLKTSNLDADNNEMISKDELRMLLRIPDACIVLRDLGIDVCGLVDIADIIFQDTEELDFPSFMEVVLQLRNDNLVTVHDLILHRKYIQLEVSRLHDVVEELDWRSAGSKEKKPLPRVPVFKELPHSPKAC